MAESAYKRSRWGWEIGGGAASCLAAATVPTIMIEFQDLYASCLGDSAQS